MSGEPGSSNIAGSGPGEGSSAPGDDRLASVAALQRLMAGDDAFATVRRRLLDETGLRPDDRVLEVGCGVFAARESVARRLAPGSPVVGLDASPGLLRRARRAPDVVDGGRVALVAGDVHRLPCLDGAFDAALADRVLAHLADPVEALREVARALAPGGRIGAFEWSLEAAEVSCGVPGFSTAYRKLCRTQAPRPAAAARLSDWLEEAGYRRVRSRSVAVASARLGPAWRRLLEEDLAEAVELGLADAPEADAWMADILELDGRGAFTARIPGAVVAGTSRRPA